MLDDQGLMETRTRDLKLRLLNADKLVAERTKWKFTNVAAPELLLLIVALSLTWFRKKICALITQIPTSNSSPAYILQQLKAERWFGGIKSPIYLQ